jgi:predicted Zn finger-like uncharacterized protein
MNVSCPQCSTIYRVDPAKVPEGGVRARCSTCGGVIPVGMTAAAAPMRRETPVDAMSAAFGERRPQAGPFIPGAQRGTPPRPVASPAPQATPRVTPPSNPRMTPPAAPRVPTPQSGPTLGASLPPLRQTPRAAAPAVTAPIATPPRPVTPQVPAPAAPISVPSVTPPSGQMAAPPAPTPPPIAASSQPSAPAPSPTGNLSGAGARRPINPFLARDPSLRAKRLARALVSDMVAYYPAKHAEGLEKGTLKELFRDEIKKSYDEYVAQVGADFARSTTHFQESLNEVLGAGRKIF